MQKIARSSMVAIFFNLIKSQEVMNISYMEVYDFLHYSYTEEKRVAYNTTDPAILLSKD